MMGKRIPALLVTLGLAAACSTPSDLSGEIVVADKAGQVVRGANVDVVLVQANEAFKAEWSRAVDDIQAGRERAVAAAKEAEAARSQALADQDAASRSASELLATKNVDWRAYDQALQRVSVATEKAVKATRRSREMRAQLETFGPRLRSKGWDLVTKYQLRVAQTDAEGRFVLAGVAPGQYFVASRFQAGGQEFYWFVPVVLEPHGKRETKLTESNAGWPFS